MQSVNLLNKPASREGLDQATGREVIEKHQAIGLGHSPENAGPTDNLLGTIHQTWVKSKDSYGL